MNDVLFISVFNYGCIDIAENHIISLINSGITNYKAYVTDEKSFDILLEKGYIVSYHPLKQPSDKLDFGTEGFNSLSYTRYIIINELLREGKIVWYLDVDTVVLTNLNNLIPDLQKMNVELVMQNDINMPCSGCMLIFPTDINKQIMNVVYNNRTSEENDQIILAHILRQNQDKIRLHLLDIESFPNGLLYFNEIHSNPGYANLQLEFRKTDKPLHFVHANWMIGVDNKINAFKSKNLWYVTDE